MCVCTYHRVHGVFSGGEEGTAPCFNVRSGKSLGGWPSQARLGGRWELRLEGRQQPALAPDPPAHVFLLSRPSGSPDSIRGGTHIFVTHRANDPQMICVRPLETFSPTFSFYSL